MRAKASFTITRVVKTGLSTKDSSGREIKRDLVSFSLRMVTDIKGSLEIIYFGARADCSTRAVVSSKPGYGKKESSYHSNDYIVFLLVLS